MDVQPGKFNCDGEDSIFKIWKRPLHKHPYDIGKRGKIGPVVRGIVARAVCRKTRGRVLALHRRNDIC